jgi:hypothetical protein
MTGMLPTIPADKWSAIEGLLPHGRRDKAVLAAVLFRQTTACGLRDTAEIFGLSRAKVHEWTTMLESDGTLARILDSLGLERAGPLRWRQGGVPHWRRRDSGHNMLQYLLDDFAAQLGQSPRQRRA